MPRTVVGEWVGACVDVVCVNQSAVKPTGLKSAPILEGTLPFLSPRGGPGTIRFDEGARILAWQTR